MVRAAFWAGVKVTVWVAFAATVTACDTVIGAPPPGGVTVAVTVADWELPVVLVTSVLTVSAELLRSAAVFWTTWALVSLTGPDTWSWIGNWMPVLLSGGIWFQSTSSRVNILVGSFGWTSSASELAPDVTTPVRSKVKRGYAPVTVAWGASSLPSTQTSAAPTTPLTTSAALCPA